MIDRIRVTKETYRDLITGLRPAAFTVPSPATDAISWFNIVDNVDENDSPYDTLSPDDPEDIASGSPLRMKRPVSSKTWAPVTNPSNGARTVNWSRSWAS